MDKTCTQCGVSKPATNEHFYSGKNGNLRSKCICCHKNTARLTARKRTPEQRQIERAKARAKSGKTYTPGGNEALRQVVQREGYSYFIKHGSSFESKMNQYTEWNATQAYDYWLRKKAPEKTILAMYADNPWKNPRLSPAKQYRVRYNTDVEFQINERIRRHFNKRRKRDGVAELIRSAINRNGDSNMVRTLLGYSISDLKAHLERMFKKGMSWDAFMRGEIHIDHIKPQASFDLSDDNEWRACWCLSNLQPLWAQDNIRKSNKIQSLI